MLRFSLPVLALLVAACGGGERPTPAAVPEEEPPEAPVVEAPARAPEVLLRGTVRLEPVPMFRSCDFQVHTEFLDSTRSRVIPTYQFLGASEEQGLYIMARGAVSPRGDVVIREIEFAGVPSDTDNCEPTAPSYVVFARGVNPSWQVSISESGLEFSQADEPHIEFPPVSAVDSGQAIVYQATDVRTGSHTLHLSLRRTGCHEGNHTYAAMRAELRIDGRVLTGCAWQGRLP